jgi:hypothetical protein
MPRSAQSAGRQAGPLLELCDTVSGACMFPVVCREVWSAILTEEGGRGFADRGSGHGAHCALQGRLRGGARSRAASPAPGPGGRCPVIRFPQPARSVPRPGHMIVCGDDALAERLAAELATVYRERVTLVVPPARPSATTGRTRAASLLGRVQAAMNRTESSTTSGDTATTRVSSMTTMPCRSAKSRTSSAYG